MSHIAESLASTIVLLVLGMAALAVLEAAIPLHARNRWNRAHLKPNLALTLVTLVTGTFLNALVIFTLLWLESKGWGLLNTVELGAVASAAIVVLALDLATYGAHVALHKVPALWRLHRVHHSDPALDVTTSLRQHPGEGLVRYAAIFAVAAVLGASPAAFAIYRVASVLTALPEHANIRFPAWLDTALSWVTTWPNVHKVHHSRQPLETDTNYGNLFSWWDRAFGTFTAAERGATVVYGLEGCDDASRQTTSGLLAMPFDEARPQARDALEGSH